MRPHVLVFGGTAEAVELVFRIVSAQSWEVTTSLAGRTQNPTPIPGRLHNRGFGGVEGLCKYLKTESIQGIVDATHPFATRISQTIIKACHYTHIPCIRLERPRWQKFPNDLWIEVPDLTTAVNILPPDRRRVLLCIGQQGLNLFAVRKDLQFIARTIEIPARTFENIVFIQRKRTVTEESEYRLLQEYAIDVLVSKNSGGIGGYGKIVAARHLGVPVIMIDRPQGVVGETAVCDGIEEVLSWLDRVYAGICTHGLS